MRILWVCNFCLPSVAPSLGLPSVSKEGWLSGLSNRLLSSENEIELGICFPSATNPDIWHNEVSREFTYKNETRYSTVTCYSFYEDPQSPEKYDELLRVRMSKILDDFNPDIIHVFGMEYAHARSLTEAVDNRGKLLVGIQGMCQNCADVYTMGIPDKKVRRSTLRDQIKQDSIKEQQQKFYERAKNEAVVMDLTGNVTGRTFCDRDFTLLLAPQARYFKMNETLRGDFYTGEWSFKECEEYRIFIAQADYPIKGFHLFLQELPEIVKHFPGVKVVVGGNQIAGFRDFKHQLKISSYGKYLDELIKKNHLENCIQFVGMQNSADMKAQYLKANVFVCCSVTENSPNCVGEAMLLGVPTVASAVGGIPDLLMPETEGFLYNPNNPGALAACVLRVFQENGTKEQEKRCREANKHASVTHDGDQNYATLLDIYQQILAKE